MFCLTSFLLILCFGMSSNAPDFGTESATTQAQVSAAQSGGGKSGMSPDQIFQGLQQNGTKGFDNPIIKGEHNDIIAQIDNKMDKSFGDINAFKGMQTADVGAKVNGSVMTPPSLNQGSIVGINSQGQGH